jgi:hypothetical protein
MFFAEAYILWGLFSLIHTDPSVSGSYQTASLSMSESRWASPVNSLVEPSLASAQDSPRLASAMGTNSLQELEAIAERECRDRMRRLGVVSAGPCIEVGAIVENLRVGTYAFNKPALAFVGEPFRLRLALKTADKQDIKESFAGLAGVVTEREGKFAQSVEATLRGDDLNIEPNGPQQRTATTHDAVEWEWTITPKAGGEKTLVIEVAANIEAGPEKHKVKVKTLREAIVI